MRKLLALGLSLAVLSAVACGRDAEEPGSVWQWVDAKGSVQFAESLDDVPEAYRGKAGKIPMSAKAMARKRAESTSADEPKVKKASTPASASAASAAPSGPVVLYVSSLFDNHQSVLIQALDDSGIAYTKVDVEKDESAKNHLRKLTRKQWPNSEEGGYAAPMLEHEEAFFFGTGKEPIALLRVHMDWVRRGRPLETPAVYIKTTCGYSTALMEDLDRIGQPYDSFDVDTDNDAAGRLVDATGSAGVPVTIVNGVVFQGYAPELAQEISDASKHPPVKGGIGAFFSTLFGS